MRPYVGITDFTTAEQVEEMLGAFNCHRHPGSRRQLHVGVMMSYKTLHRLASKWSGVFPWNEAIAGIFCSDETYNCLHYADYDDLSGPNLADDLAKAIGYGGMGIHALQLDMPWPDPSLIAKAVHISRKPVEVILQVGARALAEVNDDPHAVIGKLREYQGVIDRVLLDKSMGRGLGMDAKALLPFARAIAYAYPGLGLVAAGGLGPETMHLVEPLRNEFPNISVDAQGKLRPSGSALDPIDWSMAAEYLRQALDVLP